MCDIIIIIEVFCIGRVASAADSVRVAGRHDLFAKSPQSMSHAAVRGTHASRTCMRLYIYEHACECVCVCMFVHHKRAPDRPASSHIRVRLLRKRTRTHGSPANAEPDADANSFGYNSHPERQRSRSLHPDANKCILVLCCVVSRERVYLCCDHARMGLWIGNRF